MFKEVPNSNRGESILSKELKFKIQDGTPFVATYNRLQETILRKSQVDMCQAQLARQESVVLPIINCSLSSIMDFFPCLSMLKILE